MGGTQMYVGTYNLCWKDDVATIIQRADPPSCDAISAA